MPSKVTIEPQDGETVLTEPPRQLLFIGKRQRSRSPCCEDRFREWVPSGGKHACKWNLTKNPARRGKTRTSPIECLAEKCEKFGLWYVLPNQLGLQGWSAFKRASCISQPRPVAIRCRSTNDQIEEFSPSGQANLSADTAAQEDDAVAACAGLDEFRRDGGE